MAKVCLLTPTGDRPRQLARSRRYVERSVTEHEVEWIVVDDGVRPYDPGGCTYIRRAPDGPGSVARNVACGIERCDGDYVLIWEDDDWYSPDRIQVQVARLQHAPLHGWARTMYYHVAASRFLLFDNTRHSAFFETGFERRQLEALASIIAKTTTQFLDVLVWRTCGDDGLVDPPQRLALGIKGLPGRPGLAGHALRPGYRRDPSHRVLFRTIGADAHWYLRVANEQRRRRPPVAGPMRERTMTRREEPIGKARRSRTTMPVGADDPRRTSNRAATRTRSAGASLRRVAAVAARGEYSRATALCTAICRAHAEFAPSWRALARLHERCGDLASALECWRRATLLRPRSAAAHNRIGVLLERLGRPHEAVASYLRALSIAPDSSRFHYNLGNAYFDCDEPDRAASAYVASLQRDPRSPATHNNLGLVHLWKNDLAAAEQSFRNAIALDGAFADAYANLANVWAERGLDQEARGLYRSTIARFPAYPQGHLGLAQLALQHHDYETGWREYEWRRAAPPPTQTPNDHWDGSDLTGRAILVRAEQAVGDQIMFASILPDVVRQARRTIVECDPRLVPLFARSFPRASVRPRCAAPHRHGNAGADHDVATWIGSLPRYFRPDRGSFAKPHAFLVADSRRVRIWRTRYRALGDGLRIGISWRGGSEAYDRSVRSIPLERWAPLLATQGVHWINLQYGAAAAGARHVPGARIHEWPDADPLRDLDDFAAQVAALDLVISIDNSTVHMAGGLGTPVWALVPFAATWRWGQGDQQSAWYPSMRVFQQPTRGDWDAVFRSVRKALGSLVRKA